MPMQLAVTVVRDAPAAAPFVLRGEFADTIREAGAIGFDAVELHIADPAEVDPHEIEHACRSAGVRVASIGTGLAFLRDGVTLVHPDAEKRTSAERRMAAFIELGARLGAVVIVGLIKGQARDVGSRADYEARLRAALGELLVLADAHDARLVLEAVNRYESDVFNTIAETVPFIESLGSDRLKLHIDTFHMNTEEARIGESIRAGAGFVGHVHIADSNRRHPGAGHYDFSETIAALQAIGYAGVLSVECLGLPSPREAAVAAHGALRNMT